MKKTLTCDICGKKISEEVDDFFPAWATSNAIWDGTGHHVKFACDDHKEEAEKRWGALRWLGAYPPAESEKEEK